MVTCLISIKFNVIVVRNLVIIWRKKQYDQGRKSENHPTNTNTLTNTMFMACASLIECNIVKESPCDIWYLDSSCSNHMTGNLNLFSILYKSVQIDVTLGNNIQVIVLGKCTISILTK